MKEHGLRINLGSGQRKFGTTEYPWVNVDCQPKWEPDICADALATGLPDECAEVVVLHHVLEHFDLCRADDLLRECHRLLQPQGSVIITVPDLRALFNHWVTGRIDDYTLCVNLYGAYMGDPADLHRWGYCAKSLETKLRTVLRTKNNWRVVLPFDFRKIPGADIASAWWILGWEAVK